MFQILLNQIFSSFDRYHYAYQYSDGRELVAALPLSPMPDLILLDLGLPHMDGQQVLHWLKEQALSIPVIVISGASELAKLVKPYLLLNVKGFLDKSSSAESVLAAADDVVNGRMHLNDIMQEGLMMPDEAEKPETELMKRWKKLTDRQKEYAVLCYCFASESLQQIADRMGVELSTVHTYGRDVRMALGLSNRPDLVKTTTELRDTGALAEYEHMFRERDRCRS
jgi:DNA-binding NarL/FixJ family response regulator